MIVIIFRYFYRHLYRQLHCRPAVHPLFERLFCRFSLLFGCSTVDQQEAQAIPADSRSFGHVRCRQCDWCRFQPGRHWWRHAFRAVHDLVQHGRAPRHRLLRSHRVSHRYCRYHRLCHQRIERRGPALAFHRLCISAGTGGDCGDQHVDRPIGGCVWRTACLWSASNGFLRFCCW